MVDDVLVWTCESHGYTRDQAIKAFARNHWDKPRKARMLQDNRFQIADGSATYRIDLECKTMWWIWRESDPLDSAPGPKD